MNHIHNQKIWTILIQAKLYKPKTKENLAPQKNSQISTDLLMRRLDLLLLDLKRSLFETNKTKNTTIKKAATGVEEMMGTGQRWYVVE
jgi:hypothetical protein